MHKYLPRALLLTLLLVIASHCTWAANSYPVEGHAFLWNISNEVFLIKMGHLPDICVLLTDSKFQKPNAIPVEFIQKAEEDIKAIINEIEASEGVLEKLKLKSVYRRNGITIQPDISKDGELTLAIRGRLGSGPDSSREGGAVLSLSELGSLRDVLPELASRAKFWDRMTSPMHQAIIDSNKTIAASSGEEHTVPEFDMTELYDIYSDNQMAADEEYHGESLIVRGTLVSLKKKHDGTPYIEMHPKESPFHSIELLFTDKNNARALVKTKKEQPIAVKGICEGMKDAYTLVLRDCEIIE